MILLKEAKIQFGNGIENAYEFWDKKKFFKLSIYSDRGGYIVSVYDYSTGVSNSQTVHYQFHKEKKDALKDFDYWKKWVKV